MGNEKKTEGKRIKEGGRSRDGERRAWPKVCGRSSECTPSRTAVEASTYIWPRGEKMTRGERREDEESK